MLEIDVVLEETYNEETSEFGSGSSHRVRLEHSLVTMSKWEAIWETPFLGKKDKTDKQILSYVELMLLDDDLPPEVFLKLIENHLGEIKDYVAASMTATKLHTDPNAPGSREIITAELIYYWMISMQVPVEFEHWHLNRLVTLIRVINLKNSPKKKMSLQERRALNRARQSKHGTRG
jgi:hypothetical protein